MKGYCVGSRRRGAPSSEVSVAPRRVSLSFHRVFRFGEGELFRGAGAMRFATKGG
jgi:hypothetical protein